jgi:hypothetical protein
VVYHQQSLSRRDFHHFIDDDETGVGPDTGIIIFGMIDKDKITFLYFMDLIDTGSLAVFIAYQLSPQEPGQPLNRDGRRKLHSKEFARS